MTLQESEGFVAGVEQPPITTPQVVASECLEEAGGDWERAAQFMRLRIDSDPELFHELMWPLVDQAIWACIRGSCHATRRAYVGRPVGEDDADGLRALAGREIKKWMEYPLSGGLKLGQADRKKLLEEAAMHEAFSKSNAAKAAFFTAIAKRIDGKLVSEALTEKQVAKLAEKLL